MMAEPEEMPNGPHPDDEPLTDADLADLDRPLHEVLGIELNFAPEHLAPPIDERKLLAFIRQELHGDEREEVIGLVSSFQSWYEALGNVLRKDRG
jgi:hypothetical protein